MVAQDFDFSLAVRVDSKSSLFFYDIPNHLQGGARPMGTCTYAAGTKNGQIKIWQSNLTLKTNSLYHILKNNKILLNINKISLTDCICYFMILPKGCLLSIVDARSKGFKQDYGVNLCMMSSL